MAPMYRRRKGATSGIAGICPARSAELLTRNRKHLERVPGLVVA